MSWYRWENTDLILSLRVQTRASRDEFTGVQNDQLRLRITAAPVDGRANKHIIAKLAKEFGVAQSKVELIRGDRGRDKQIRVRTPTKIPQALSALLNNS